MVSGLESRTVLVAGGGLVGLSTAAFLAWHGVDCLVVERRKSAALHPRARGFNPRAVELLRSIGMEQEVRAAAAGFADHTMRARLESLAGAEFARSDLPTAALGELSPSSWALCSQDRLEPLIRARAEKLGAEVRFGQELRSLTQDADGVTGVVRGADGERRIRAHYLVAADGANSMVRRALGIGVDGTRGLNHQLSILFEADLAEALRGRRFAICQIDNPAVRGLLVHDDTLRRGTLYVECGSSAEDIAKYTAHHCAKLVEAAIGSPGLPIRVLGAEAWELSALTAEAYAAGRVFLAGDAAHVMPPVSGFGASTGLQDAHNLAWKLAYTIRGIAGPGLLDSYQAERAPVGALTVRQCRLRVTTRTGFGPPGKVPGLIGDLALTFGSRYRSDVLTGAGFPGEEALAPPDLAGQPGTRAPHLPVTLGDREMSVLDLFGAGFTLLTDASGEAWLRAARQVGTQLSLELDAYAVGGPEVADPTGSWASRYRTRPGEAVLVRPDGVVSWRSAGDPPDQGGGHVERLAAAVCTALGMAARPVAAAREAFL
ncbi:FAD-dependent monooxygenase [Streptosporangium soli]|nr:FAD-dependent monooxygenase [Streptosporangium sp. KLBMP 9127]